MFSTPNEATAPMTGLTFIKRPISFYPNVYYTNVFTNHEL